MMSASLFGGGKLAKNWKASKKRVLCCDLGSLDYGISEIDVFFMVPLHHCRQPHTFFLMKSCGCGVLLELGNFFGRVEVIE